MMLPSGKSDAAHQVIEASVRAQGIETGIYLEVGMPHVMRVVSFFKPTKCFLFFSKAGIDESDFMSSYAISPDIIL